MLRSYKYQLRPTNDQKVFIDKNINACRFVYNLALETKINAYRHGKKLSAFDLMKQLTELKAGVDWLNEVILQSLQQSIIDMDSAFINFFKKRAKYPNFKKKSGKQSYRIRQSIAIDFDAWTIKTPKCDPIQINRDRIFTGQIKQATISKMPTGKYFISILVETGTPKIECKPIQPETTVGIDLGLKHFIILSNGKKVDSPRFLTQSAKRLRVEQRSFYRKKKGSKRREAQKLVVAKLHEKIANQRKDFLHKLSTEITNQYDAIAIENLNVSGMVRNHCLAKSISDASWGEFVTFLKYKADWYGKNILQIGRFEPSSRLCPCGVINKELKLHQREWVCETCGTVHDRDILAANNIKTIGLRTQPNIRQREAVACA